MLNRTAAAFTFSCEKLREENKRLYFWTWTFKQTPAWDWLAMDSWNFLNRRLKKNFPWLQGVRVCELHKSHGIHFHAIINGRIPWRRMREIFYGSGKCYGNNHYLDFGKIDVAECDDGVIDYLASYLRKQYTCEHELQNHRRWGTMGGFKGYSCKGVVYENSFTRNKPLLYGDRQMDFPMITFLRHFSNCWGDLDNWPADVLVRFQNLSTMRLGERIVEERSPVSWRENSKPAIEWNKHLENCGQCQFATRMCQRGYDIWWDAISEGIGKQAAQVKPRYKMLHSVTNSTLTKPLVSASEASVLKKRKPPAGEIFLGGELSNNETAENTDKFVYWVGMDNAKRLSSHRKNQHKYGLTNNVTGCNISSDDENWPF